MTRTKALDRGREALRKRAWGEAFANLSAADREAPVEPADLEGLAMAALLLGRDSDFVDTLARAHQGFLSVGNTQRAARCAFWLGFFLFNNAEPAQAGGWLARAGRLLDDGQIDCVEKGYLLVPQGIRTAREGDPDGAYTMFVEAAAIGNRFRDMDLVALAMHCQGRALIRCGETIRGVSLLDEAMIAVTAGEVSPMIAGGVYCSVLDACHEILDLGRAQEWTAALDQWCASQPDLVPYRGQCLLRRAEIMQLHGAWPDALDQARQAHDRFSTPPPKPAVGAAFYRMAELHRLRGEFGLAEEAYRQAGQWERAPRPGFALLRLAQGGTEAAYAAIRHLADEALDPGSRTAVLDAFVEIALAAGDIESARGASKELAEIAAKLDATMPNAVSARAAGAVLLAEGDPRGALAALRRSWDAWREIEAPYEEARVRVLIALACRALGDEDTADIEIDVARGTFQHLGASPDLARIENISRRDEAKASGPLTAREVQVLGLIASGMTNREIADKLVISEKTVARHVSNIFVKLDLSSRAAATAYAYKNDLV